MKLPRVTDRQPEKPRGIKCRCGYWHDPDDKDNDQKEIEIRNRVSEKYRPDIREAENKRDYADENKTRGSLKKETEIELIENHLVPFRPIVVKMSNRLNPNFSSEGEKMTFHACPDCGGLMVRESIDFFFEPVNAVKRATERYETHHSNPGD
jgi:hypothetical protein